MLTKRIIPCLDVKDGQTVKGVNFENLKYAGDPVSLAKKYSDEGADELVFLDITATNDGRKTMLDVVEKVAKEVFIPFTVGGGIKSIEDIRNLLLAGADKVSLNTAAVKNPALWAVRSAYSASSATSVRALSVPSFLRAASYTAGVDLPEPTSSQVIIKSKNSKSPARFKAAWASSLSEAVAIHNLIPCSRSKCRICDTPGLG